MHLEDVLVGHEIEGIRVRADAGSRHPPARRRQALRRRSPPSTASTSTVPDGTCVGLLGPNGAGKSTTMRLLTAQAIADEGEIEVLGLPLPERVQGGARRRCGVVPQLDNLDSTLTVEQNLLVFTHLYRVAARRAARPRSSARWRSRTSRDRRDAQVDELSRRHAPAAADRPRARAPAAARAARRADRRPGPAGAPGAVGADRPAAQRGRLDPDVHALHRGGRAPRRHRDDHVATASAVAVGAPRDLVAEHAGREALEVYGPPARLREVEARGAQRGWPTRRTGTSVDDPARRDARTATLPEGERRTANLEDVFVLLTGEEIA